LVVVFVGLGFSAWTAFLGLPGFRDVCIMTTVAKPVSGVITGIHAYECGGYLFCAFLLGFDEIPSPWLEYKCFDIYLVHHQNGDPLPPEL